MVSEKSVADVKALQDIKQQANIQPSQQFAEWSLAYLRRYISFDKALWGVLSHSGEMDILTGHNLDLQAFIENYQAVAHLDPQARAMKQNPLKAVFATTDNPPAGTHPNFSKWITKYAGPIAINIGLSHPRTGVIQGISLFRLPNHSEFTPADGAILEQFAPVLFDGLRSSREVDIKNRLFTNWTDTHFVAMTNAYGVVFDMEDEFYLALKRAWPKWNGPKLPRELTRLMQENPAQWKLRKGPILVSCQPYAERYHLVITNLGSIGSLTARQYSIAELYAQGMNTKTIADRLFIEVATVENHRKNIYQKLAISSNNELTRLFDSLYLPLSAI